MVLALLLTLIALVLTIRQGTLRAKSRNIDL
jgi:hypothetical protein